MKITENHEKLRKLSTHPFILVEEDLILKQLYQL